MKIKNMFLRTGLNIYMYNIYIYISQYEFTVIFDVIVFNKRK